jgi:uncharacterized protein (UPF0332 family)
MTFDWKEYYILSLELVNNTLGNCNIESQLRTAISRSYYAAFCSTRILLKESEGIILIGDYSIHTEIINELNKLNLPSYNTISTELLALKRLRVLVDYENEVWNLESKARLAIQRCKTIFDTIQSME